MTSSFRRRAMVPAAGLLAGSILVVSTADGQATRTLEFQGQRPVTREIKEVDVRPRGQSVGDHYVLAASLRSNGALAGRLHAICTIVDRGFKGQDCDFVLVLRDGTVTASGGGLNRLLPGQVETPPRSPDEYAVTGGTGAYSGASGILSIEDNDDEETGAVKLTI